MIKEELNVKWDPDILSMLEYIEKQRKLIIEWKKPILPLTIIGVCSLVVYLFIFPSIFIALFGVFILIVVGLGWPIIISEQKKLEKDDYIHTQTNWKGPKITFTEIDRTIQNFLVKNKYNYTMKKKSYYAEYNLELEDINIFVAKTQPGPKTPLFGNVATSMLAPSYVSVLRISFRPSNFVEAKKIRKELDYYLSNMNLI